MAFPDFDVPEDGARLDALRARYTAPHASEVGAHLTLVFGTTHLDRDAFVTHVGTRAAAAAPISLRLAAPVIWPEDGAFLLFALPDTGLAETVALHDRLYSDPLAPTLRTDLPYVPHVTLGRLATHDEAVRARDALREVLPITATLRALTVVAAEDRLKPVADLPLGVAA